MSRDPFKMLYCENPDCSLDTFEQGDTGICPECGQFGEEIQTWP